MKLSRSFAGFKFDGQIGRSSKRSGIRLVKIVSATHLYLYEIGKTPIRFELPASVVEFDGDVATVIYLN